MQTRQQIGTSRSRPEQNEKNKRKLVTGMQRNITLIQLSRLQFDRYNY